MKVSTNARFCVHVMLPLLSEVGSTNADSLLVGRSFKSSSPMIFGVKKSVLEWFPSSLPVVSCISLLVTWHGILKYQETVNWGCCLLCLQSIGICASLCIGSKSLHSQHAGDGLTIQSRYTKTCNWNGADVCNSRIIHGRYVNILASVWIRKSCPFRTMLQNSM